MDFFSLKNERTFREWLSIAGYGIKKDIDHGRYQVLSVHETMQHFADDMGISIRTAQRYYKENNAPKVYIKLLKIMSGYLDEIHPDWSGFGINVNSGELFCQENKALNFTPQNLLSAYWHRERAADYQRLMLKLETEREKLKHDKKAHFSQYLTEIENAASKAAADAIRTILDIEPSTNNAREPSPHYKYNKSK